MKNSILYILFVVVLISGCTKDFEEINTNPNSPISVQPSLLLRQVLYDFGEELSYEGFVAGNLLSQHFTMVDFNLFDRHDLSSPQLGGNPWPTIYTNLRDNELLLEQSRTNPLSAVYEGPALILKAYLTAALTDIYGDVPYFEAVQGKSNGIVNPSYDAQSDIYQGADGILDNLNQGLAAIENYRGTQALDGDIILGGDLSRWTRLANSLRIKYLMRISNVSAVAGDLQSIYDGGNYIQESADNATFDFLATQPNTFRLTVLRAGDFNLFVLSETMQEILSDLDDPRISVLFRPASNTPGVFSGLLNGPDASNTSISVADFSLTGTIFRENSQQLDANFMTNWETLFLLAEAAERNLIDADASALYNQAVAEAFAYWQTDLPADYLTTGRAAYGSDGQNPVEQIITQKWIANSINGYEGWIEYRRTGFPNLKTISASLNNDLIPVRMPYPAEEAALNSQNYEQAISGNQNSVNSRVWWDVD